jgi:hypothetical protein
VLDLFDEELFQNIAYDPEAWLYNLLQVQTIFLLLQQKTNSKNINSKSKT